MTLIIIQSNLENIHIVQPTATIVEVFTGSFVKALALAVLLLGQETPSPNGVVTGQILALNGGPATNTRVVAMAAPTPGAADAGFAVFESISQTDASGRYRLERVPPGKYIIAAGFIDSPSYYPGVKVSAEARIITVAAGQTVAGIDFTLTQPAGVRVFGRVSGMPPGTPAGMVRVVVLPTSGMRVPGAVPEALVQPDGSFEFLKMPPGKYTLRLLPASPVVTVPIDVQDQDVGPLALSLGVAVSGRVLIEGGGELPPRKDAPLGMANVPPLLGLQARRTDSGAGPAVQLRPDGTFLWMAPVGEYRLGVTMLPFGYSVKSMEYGTANLVEVPLKITDPLENPSATIRITLTTTPLPNESAGVKVSGQVLGIPGGASSGEFWVRLQTSVAPASITQGVLQRVGEAQLRNDGTFELIRVPPGVYNAQVFPRSGPPISGGMAIVVESADVTGAQLVANPAPISSIISSPSPLPLTSPGAGTLPSTEPRGVGVRGNIQLSFAGAYPDTVVLFGSRPGGLTFEVPVRKDGSFEFKNVPPGMYDARTLPLAAPPKSTTLLIEGRDLTGVQISIPPLTEVRGQIDLEGGGRVADVSTLGIKLISTDGSIEIPVSRDGRFAMKINQGEYRVSVTRLPTNSVVRKMTHGTTDLSKASYNTNTSGEIRITIGAAP